jgi:hypothetical protein
MNDVVARFVPTRLVITAVPNPYLGLLQDRPLSSGKNGLNNSVALPAVPAALTFSTVR